MRRVLSIIVVLLVVATPALAGSSLDVKLDNKINHLRVKHDQRPYKINDKLTSFADQRSRHLAKIQELKHTPNLMDKLPKSYAVGEIIAYGPTLRSVYRSFKHSAPHKAIMLSKMFRQEGAGLTRDSHGTLWVVVVFRKPAR